MLFFIEWIILPLRYYPHDHTSYGPITAESRWYTHVGLTVLGILAGLFITFLIVRKLIILAKKQKVLKFIHEFQKDDAFWDEKQMRSAAEGIFMNVQAAWEKRSLYQVTGFITDGLKAKWEKNWLDLADKNIGFHCGQLELINVIIVGAENSSNDNKDNFSVEVSGYAKRYFYHRSTRAAIVGNTNQLEHYSDIYTFVRRDKKWLLDNIKYKTGLLDILQSDISDEGPDEPGKPEET